jgi:MFS family permease
VYGLTYAVMGTSRAPGVFLAALLCYGAFYGFTEGVEKALLADLLPPEARGTGFGALQAILGLGALLASPLMGLLMALAGAKVAFLATGALALAATLALATWAGVRRRTVQTT